MENKWADTGVSVCDQTVKKWQREAGFPSRKVKRKLSLTPDRKKQGHSGLKRSGLTVDVQMKVIFSDELPICIGKGGDAGTSVWCRSNEKYKDD